jgi:hypothetical protein
LDLRDPVEHLVGDEVVQGNGRGRHRVDAVGHRNEARLREGDPAGVTTGHHQRRDALADRQSDTVADGLDDTGQVAAGHERVFWPARHHAALEQQVAVGHPGRFDPDPRVAGGRSRQLLRADLEAAGRVAVDRVHRSGLHLALPRRGLPSGFRR